MAETPSYIVQQVFVNEVDEEEKWAKHYSSKHQILLVGEGDFSFSFSLASSFRSASNIVATSLDSRDDVIKKYKEGKANLRSLSFFGAKLLHGVDATNMHLHSYLQTRKFDRIIFNFPHAGFFGKEDNSFVIMMHQELVDGFFESASQMLLPNGEVHVTHKTETPYYRWNIKQLAAQNSLAFKERVKFTLEDYPGYYNKRGQGSRCDEPFRLGKCSTFKFVFSLHVDFSDFFDGSEDDENIAYDVPNDELIMGLEGYEVENCGGALSDYTNFWEELKDLI